MIIAVKFSDGTIERKESSYVSSRADGVLCALRYDKQDGATILEPCERVDAFEQEMAACESALDERATQYQARLTRKIARDSRMVAARRKYRADLKAGRVEREAWADLKAILKQVMAENE